MALTENPGGLANTLGNVTRTAYELAFETSPIILNQGIVAKIPGGMMPLGILGVGATLLGALPGVSALSSYLPDAKFMVLPGATAVSNDVATYPFANRYVAANAVIRKPKTVSLILHAPVNSTGGYLLKTGLFTAMQKTLESHIAAGGTFHILTPSMIYFDCLLTNVSDVTGAEGHQQQIQWQFDFVQPLITQYGATSAYNAMMGALDGGQKATSSSSAAATAAAGVAAQDFIV